MLMMPILEHFCWFSGKTGVFLLSMLFVSKWVLPFFVLHLLSTICLWLYMVLYVLSFIWDGVEVYLSHSSWGVNFQKRHCEVKSLYSSILNQKSWLSVWCLLIPNTGGNSSPLWFSNCNSHCFLEMWNKGFVWDIMLVNTIGSIP